MILATPPAVDVLNASATATTAGLITVPLGRWFTGNVQLSTSVSVAGTSAPHVNYTVTGGTTGAAPATGSTLSRLTVTGLALTTVTSADTNEIFVYGGDPAGGGTGCTIDFTAGATGSSSVTINGFLI
jgi:hypothetical protein